MKTLFLSLILSASFAFSGTARHVIVAGGLSSGAAADSAHGWTLSWALDPSNSVRQPGDTMYLHTGTYLGRHNVTVSGSAGNPLVYRNWQGQRAVLSDNSDPYTVWTPWQIMGNYVWLWGIEVTHGNPTNGGDADLISIQGSYDKIINCYVHDALSLGIDDFGTGCAGTEVVGNVFQYNGRGPIHWNGSPYKSQPGYAAYVQNKVPSVQKLYRHNIVANQWDCGMQFYGSNETILSNIKVAHSVYFNNGNLWSESGSGPSDERYKPNYYFGPGETGAGPMDKDTVLDVISFYSMTPTRGNNVFLGYNGDGYTNFAVDSCYFYSPNANGSYTSVAFCCGIAPANGLTSFRGNVVFGTYSPGGLASQWGAGSGDTYYASSGSYPARGVEVFIDPNPYESKRANITVFNPSGGATVSVDPSSVLSVGDVYHIKAATNFNGADVASGTYAGGSITITASDFTMAATIGGYETFPAVNPQPYLLSMVLLGPNTPTSPPPASAPSATTTPATGISSSGATLNGIVNPNGASTTYHFEWGTSVSYGHSTSSTSAGSGTDPIAENSAISGLSSGTTYHYRIVANNSNGTGTGSDIVFTTSGGGGGGGTFNLLIRHP